MWSVIVGNIGKVCEFEEKGRAVSLYNEYIEISMQDEGSRCYKESVYLLKDGEQIEVFEGESDKDSIW